MKKVHLSTLFLLLLCIISLISCEECNSAYKPKRIIRTVSIADIRDKAEKTGIKIDIDKEEVINLTGLYENGNNILHHAIFKGADIQLITFLLEELSDKRPSKLETMLNQLNPMGETPFLLAIQQRNVELIELLRDYGAKPTQKELIEAFKRAISSGDVDLVKCVMKLGKKIPLSFNLPILQLVVNSPVDHPDLVEYILEETDLDINSKDKEGNTVLHNAILKGSESTVTVLLNTRHPDVNVQNAEGKTPLLLAIEKVSAPIVSDLLREGADPTLPNRDGKLPLEIAQEKLQEQKLSCVENNKPRFIVDKLKKKLGKNFTTLEELNAID
jgi:ankyrin repeat protein